MILKVATFLSYFTNLKVMKAGEIRIEIEYPIFRKIKKEGEKTSLEEVRKILSKIKRPLAEEILRERDEEWR